MYQHTPIPEAAKIHHIPSDAKQIGLSGRDGSVRQKTSAKPSEASGNCGSCATGFIMLDLTTCIYRCAVYAGRSFSARKLNAACALVSSSKFVVFFEVVDSSPTDTDSRPVATALAYLMAFSAFVASR